MYICIYVSVCALSHSATDCGERERERERIESVGKFWGERERGQVQCVMLCLDLRERESERKSRNLTIIRNE